MLQGSTLDVLEGHQMVSTVKSKIIATRNDDIEFDKVHVWKYVRSAGMHGHP